MLILSGALSRQAKRPPPEQEHGEPEHRAMTDMIILQMTKASQRGFVSGSQMPIEGTTILTLLSCIHLGKGTFLTDQERIKLYEGLFCAGDPFYFNFQGVVPQRASTDLYQLHAWKALGKKTLIGHQSLVSCNIPARAIVLNNISKINNEKLHPGSSLDEKIHGGSQLKENWVQQVAFHGKEPSKYFKRSQPSAGFNSTFTPSDSLSHYLLLPSFIPDTEHCQMLFKNLSILQPQVPFICHDSGIFKEFTQVILE